MIPNTNDGTADAPRLRCYLNLMALNDLPDWSAGPESPDPEPRLSAMREAGYDGVQFIAPATTEEIRLCEYLGLGHCSLGRVNDPSDAEELAARFADEGQECATLHVGWGMEDDSQASHLIEAILSASDKYQVPLYPETHRATIFQDIWRAVQFVGRFPALRFNGDFSHWYTGLEMRYGDFDQKLAFLGPVLERVRFVHGRIGNPGCIQVAVGGPGDQSIYVGHFRQMWTAAFAGFLDTAAPGDYLCFTPELLSPQIFYARVFPFGEQPREESDRWSQSLVLKRIAEECWSNCLQASQP